MLLLNAVMVAEAEEDEMRKFIRRNLPLIVTVSAVSILAVSFMIAQSNRSQKKSGQVPLLVKQATYSLGMFPAELECTPPRMTGTNQLDGFSCVLHNNSGKTIVAATMSYAVITEKDGREGGAETPTYMTFESFVHRDLQMEHIHHSLDPGGEETFDVNEITRIEDADIKTVEVNLDYVEFGDSSTLGPNLKGSAIVGDIRSGASKYRDWLQRQFVANGKSVESVLPLLKREQGPPSDISLQNRWQKQGAMLYRDHALKISNLRGADELKKMLGDSAAHE